MPVDYHAWTHRPKSQGGTDPIETDGGQWIVLKDIETGQLFPADSETTVVYQEVVNDYPSYFDTDVLGSDIYAVVVLQDGLYSAHLSLPLDELNVPERVVHLVNVDPLGGPRYHRETYLPTQSATGPGLAGADAAEWTIRLAAGEKIWWNMYNVDPAVDFNSRDDGGAYFEVRLLNTSSVNGRVRDIAT